MPVYDEDTTLKYHYPAGFVRVWKLNSSGGKIWRVQQRTEVV